VLRSVYDAAANTISIELVEGGHDLPTDSHLALTSVVQLTPPNGSAVRLVRRLASYHEFADVATSGLTGLNLSHRPRHANDGPVSAFLIHPDGNTSALSVEPMRRARTRTARGAARRASGRGRGCGASAGSVPGQRADPDSGRSSHRVAR
jgi:hypothetical protein